MTKVNSLAHPCVSMVASGKVKSRGSGSMVRSRNVADRYATHESGLQTRTSNQVNLPGHNIYSACHDGTYYFLASDAMISRSVDGLTWQPAVTFPVGVTRGIVSDGNGTIIARRGVASTTSLLVSNDHGATWSTPTLPISGVFSVGYGNGRWIASPNSVSTQFLYSDNSGVTWNLGGNALPFSPTFYYTAPQYQNGLWVIGSGYQTQLAYSNDGGNTWSTKPCAITTSGILANGGYFVGIYEGSTAISTDGVNWNAGKRISASGQGSTTSGIVDGKVYSGSAYVGMYWAKLPNIVDWFHVDDSVKFVWGNELTGIPNGKTIIPEGYGDTFIFDSLSVPTTKTVTY